MIVTTDSKVNTRLSSMIPLYNVFASENAFIAGGAIRSIFANEEINDFDIYFEDKENYYNVVNYLDKRGIGGVISSNAYNFKINNRKYQLIHHSKMIGNPEYILSHFDFTVCMGAYSFKDKTVIYSERFLLDLAKRELVYNKNTLFPISSLVRTKKYLKRGYNINTLEYLKIISHIHSLLKKVEEDNDKDLLKEQFNGLDVVLIENIMDIESASLEHFIYLAESLFFENDAIELVNYSLN
ncbi:MAG: hypothetical protein KatS3mg002_1085 [Candidatus Woesearchaeota archaeon]|nr:MAG: hypothetical protein KatS3mg002_1085 [Candidatus Woesearchaeota archaeon]